MTGLGDLRGELPPFPGRDKIPMLLLLQPAHFTQLFSLMDSLSRWDQLSESANITLSS